MNNDLETFISDLKFKIEPAYVKCGDKVSYGDFSWVVKSVYRNNDGVPTYGISHWLAGMLNEMVQSRLYFLAPKNKGPIWTLDVYNKGKRILHNEDIQPDKEENPLFVSIDISRWPSLTFLNWLENFIFDPMYDECADMFLTLRTHKGHYVDGWYFQGCMPIRQTKEENNQNIWFDYWKKEKLKPMFDLPKVIWSQYSYDECDWIGTARAADIEVVVDGAYESVTKFGNIYQADYRLLCVDFMK